VTKDARGHYDCPLERRIAAALDKAGIEYVRESAPQAANLDFYLTQQSVHIEVKAFHSERISRQMARVPYCIAVQGKEAADWLASLIERGALPATTTNPATPQP